MLQQKNLKFFKLQNGREDSSLEENRPYSFLDILQIEHEDIKSYIFCMENEDEVKEYF